MHCRLHLVTKGKPSYDLVAKIMNPYCEGDFYGQYYDEDSDDFVNIPKRHYPEFLWDYWDLWDDQKPAKEVSIGECYTLIDKNRTACSREKWNGKEYKDQTAKFEKMAERITRGLKDDDWVTIIDYHY